MALFPRYGSHHGYNSALSPFFKLLEDPFFVPTTTSRTKDIMFQPKFDVHETPDAFVLDGEVPGITDKSALDIHFADQQTLVIKGRIEKIRHANPDLEENADTGAEKQPEHGPSKKATVEDEVEESAGDTSVARRGSAPGHRVWVQERSVGEFQRSFNFPAGIDQDNVKASLKDGLLTVTVPKMAQKGKRKITVE